MQQNATPETDRACELSPAKATVLEALLAGSTVTEAALAAEVDRSTLYRWQRDPSFLATYNGRRAEMREAAEAKLQKLQKKALDAVERALDEGDSRVALTVLRGMGLLDGKRPTYGSDDPARVAKDRRATARKQELADRNQEMIDSLSG
jgi:hypothetical protein